MINESIYRSIYIIGSMIRGTPVVPYLDDLKESQWWDSGRMKEYQIERLRGLITHTRNNSAYYRDMFNRHGIGPDIDSLEDLQRLPVSTKQDIRHNSARIQNAGHGGRLIPSKTSGSSGEPLKFYRGSDWDAQHRAAVARGYGWYGVQPWSRSGLLWGIPSGRKEILKTRIGDLLQNRFRERRFDFSESTLEDFCRRLSGASFLEGYSSMIYELARYMNTRRPGGWRGSLSLVKGTSEKIYPRYSDETLEAFGRRMTSEYGAAEAGIIAFECPQGTMHVNAEHVIVEEEEGRIIVTNLLSHSFPFIRYSLGDYVEMGRESSCPCGRRGPVIREITGRIGRKIRGRSGGEFPSLTVYYIINALYAEFPGLFRIQAVQRKRGSLDFLAVFDGSGDPVAAAPLRDRVMELSEEYYRGEIESSLVPVESISDAGGKRLDFISGLEEC